MTICYNVLALAPKKPISESNLVKICKYELYENKIKPTLSNFSLKNFPE